MGYKSILTCKQLRNYEEAINLFKAVKPLRGTECRPLGSRKYGRDYSIGMNGDDVECRIGTRESAAITFHPDNTLTLKSFWSGVDCNQMFGQVLGIHAYTERGFDIVVINDIKYVYDGKIMLRIIKPEARYDVDRYEVIEPIRYGDWKLNKSKANKARKQYAGYIKYVNAMCRLRRTDSVNGYAKGEIHFSFDEMDIHFNRANGVYVNSTKHDNKDYLNVDGSALSGTKLHESTHSEHLAKLIGLMSSDKPSDWHKAMCVLVLARSRHGARGDYYTMPISALEDMSKSAIYEWHKKEILEWHQLELGKVPTRTYDGWMRDVKSDSNKNA